MTTSAWSKDIDAAPKDRQVLFRGTDWECPAVVHWDAESSIWMFSETMLEDMEGGVDPTMLGDMEWAPIPE